MAGGCPILHSHLVRNSGCRIPVVRLLWECCKVPQICYAVYMKTKQCLYCNRRYPESSFGVALTTKKKVFRRRKCCHCYRETKQTLIQKYYKWLNDYKIQRGCKRCGTIDGRVLDFHHKDEKNKLFSIGSFRRSVGIKRIKNEVKKCEIYCANCHRIHHAEMRINS